MPLKLPLGWQMAWISRLATFQRVIAQCRCCWHWESLCQMSIDECLDVPCCRKCFSSGERSLLAVMALQNTRQISNQQEWPITCGKFVYGCQEKRSILG